MQPTIDNAAMYKISYGLFVLTAQEDGFDNGCIINTAIQVTDTPKRLAFAVNKANKTHDMIFATGKAAISVLTEKVPFEVFQRFGFQSGKDTDKFVGFADKARCVNGLYHLTKYANAYYAVTVINKIDCGTHTMFIADIDEAKVLNDDPSVTYAYYFEHIKPSPNKKSKAKGYVCTICGYEHEEEDLPADFICPLCKHDASYFVPIE